MQAVLSVVFLAIQPIAAYYVPESPNNVEPTSTVVAVNHLLGYSPRITDGPILNLRDTVDFDEKRANTCGWNIDGTPLTCPPGATCASGSSFVGCCKSGTTCSSMIKSCTDGSKAMSWVCSQKEDQSGGLCCDGTISPVCMLITLSLSSTTLGAWECGTKSTGGTFYATNPLRPVRPSSPPTPTSGSSSSENKVNTDAIIGGTVGGVGGLAIIAAAVFFFMRYRKKNAVDNNSTTTAAAQPVFQHYQSPHPMVYQHYQGSQQFYPTPPSESPYSPQQCGHAGWGQPPPGPAHLGHTVTQPVELG